MLALFLIYGRGYGKALRRLTIIRKHNGWCNAVNLDMGQPWRKEEIENMFWDIFMCTTGS